MEYSRALGKIYAYSKFGSILGLSRVRRVAAALGNPQGKFNCIIVGGSNGKGSTVRMIASVLLECGFRVGEYYSPQVEDFGERFLVDGSKAEKREIVGAFLKVQRGAKKAGVQLTFFELLTLMAFEIFKKEKVQWAVLEVGLGGKGDAVNICRPKISALASIGLEHTDVLGESIAKIAHEKCAIARRGKMIACGSMDSKARAIVQKECKKIGATPLFVGREIKVRGVERENGKIGFGFCFEGKKTRIKTAMGGEWQASNAAVAAACAMLACNAGEKQVKRGIAKAKLPCRLQKEGNVVFDCAHNEPAIRALAQEIGKMAGKSRTVWVFGAMRDKKISEMLRQISKVAGKIVLTQAELQRSAKARELAAIAKAFFPAGAIYVQEDAKLALALGRKLAGKNGLAVVGGSMYVLGAARGKKPKVAM